MARRKRRGRRTILSGGARKDRDHGDVEGRALTLDNWLPNEEPHRSVGITTVDGLGTYAELRPCLYCAHDRPIVIAIPGDALPKSWGKCIETHHG